MRYLMLILFLFCTTCKSQSYYTNRAITEMECEWASKYSICICVSTGYKMGYMTWVPDHVCKDNVMYAKDNQLLRKL
jgi:hypothetical protein